MTVVRTAVDVPDRPIGATTYTLLLIYYWALQFAIRSGGEVPRGGLLYFLFVIPVALFSALWACAVVTWIGVRGPAALMTLYATIVATTAMLRGDLQTVMSTVLFSLTVVVVFACRLTPSARLLNTLLLASIPVNTLLFLGGWSIYAPLPGYSQDGELWWRVSLFPEVATSAYFCLLVLVVNVLHRGAPMRRSCIAVAGYFLVFSGLRSALIAGLLIGGYALLVHLGVLRRSSAKLGYLALGIATFVVSLFASQLLLLFPVSGNETLNTYLFRSSGGLQSEADAARTIYRTYIWSEHMRLASQNPILGIGTFDFTAVSIYDPVFGDYGRGSEAFLTGLFARVGLPALLLLATFVAAIMNGVRAGQHLHLAVGIVLFVAMLAYGSFINAYDFVFLAMLGLLASAGERMWQGRQLPGRG